MKRRYESIGKTSLSKRRLKKEGKKQMVSALSKANIIYGFMPDADKKRQENEYTSYLYAIGKISKDEFERRSMEYKKKLFDFSQLTNQSHI